MFRDKSILLAVRVTLIVLFPLIKSSLLQTHMQTSAKENIGITDGFRKIIEEAVQANLINLAFNKKPDQLEGVNKAK